jgi:hypothetical protein
MSITIQEIIQEKINIKQEEINSCETTIAFNDEETTRLQTRLAEIKADRDELIALLDSLNN